MGEKNQILQKLKAIKGSGHVVHTKWEAKANAKKIIQCLRNSLPKMFEINKKIQNNKIMQTHCQTIFV